MTKNNLLHLPEDYALVLQQIKENGEEDFLSLAESLSISKGRLHHIIESLHRKRLITINWSKWSESWIRLSAKGQKLTNYIWPEMNHMNSAYNVL